MGFGPLGISRAVSEVTVVFMDFLILYKIKIYLVYLYIFIYAQPKYTSHEI